MLRNPGSYALNIAFAETALASGDPNHALQQLKQFQNYRSDEPRVYQLLSRAAGDLDQQALGHKYLSEYYYLIGSLKQAILQLEIALKRPELDFYESSRLESRLAEFRAEQDEEERKRSARR